VTDFGARVGVAPKTVARIRAHIMGTRHVALPADNDSRLVVDIDLTILGAAPSRYEEFERDVRQEYRWVPGIVYRPKRAATHSWIDQGSITASPRTSNLSAKPARACLKLSEI
jgi:predicted metal-dependent HD superfamily phosphohydrolase